MDAENILSELILKNMSPEQQQGIFESVKVSTEKAKAIQKQKIAENVDIVIQALKKIESDIRSRYDDLGNLIEKRVSTIQDGRDGINGTDGRDGRDGKAGKDGLPGRQGAIGPAGKDGLDGVDGISVANAYLDFDGGLVIALSNGNEINVGEIVPMELASQIKVITNGGGTSQYVLDALTSLQTQINTLIPSQTGNSGKFLTTDGTTTSWATAGGGGGSVTSVTGTSPVVSSGGATPAISLASAYGDTLNPYASKTANYVLAAPNGTSGVPTFRAIVAADIPTLNQNTTGTAANVTTNANLTGAITSVGNATSLGSFTSANLLGALTDETGTGSAVFATSPTLVTPILGTPTSGVATNLTGLPLTTGVTGTLPVGNGGTGATTLTANNVILGNGTSAVQVVAPSTSGNVLTSNGTTWVSSTPSSGISTGKSIAMAMIFGF
jgi:hypothetical protein